jgi:hypothetical protein
VADDLRVHRSIVDIQADYDAGNNAATDIAADRAHDCSPTAAL